MAKGGRRSRQERVEPASEAIELPCIRPQRDEGQARNVTSLGNEKGGSNHGPRWVCQASATRKKVTRLKQAHIRKVSEGGHTEALREPQSNQWL